MNKLDEIAKAGCAACYEDVRGMVHSTARRFWLRYGGDAEEIESRARCAFLEVYEKFDPSRAKLTTWVAYKVYRQLLRELQRERKELNGHRILRFAGKQAVEGRVKDESYGPDEKDAPVPYAQEEFKREEFLEELSEDAQTVARMALDPPVPVVAGALARGGTTANNVKNAIKEFLYDLGWTAARIFESFNEVREALR